MPVFNWLSRKGFERFGSNLPIRETDCSFVWNITSADRCEWVKNTIDCKPKFGYSYPEILFCHFSTEKPIFFGFGCFLLLLWLIYLFLILASTADNFFCPSLGVISNVFRLSDSIAGVTILAFGNGSPDIFTSLASELEETMIMITELIGAGIFVTTIIAGSVAVFSPFRVNWKFLIRDCAFYILSTSWISYIVQDQIIHMWEALNCILLYILFILTVALMQYFESREIRKQSNSTSRMNFHSWRNNVNMNSLLLPRSNPESVRHGSFEYLLGKSRRECPSAPSITSIQFWGENVAIAKEFEVNKLGKKSLQEGKSLRPRGLFREFLFDVSPINIDDWRSANVPLKILHVLRAPFMFPLQLLVPVVNETSEKRGWSKLLNCVQMFITPIIVLLFLNAWNQKIKSIPLIVIAFPFFLGLSVIVFLMTSQDHVPAFHNVYAFLGFFVAMFVVYFIASEVLLVLECIGFVTRTSDAMLGITFLAWGNSIGDLISNVTISRKGYPKMGFAACFGGPMFNTLMGMGLTLGIAASRNEDYKVSIRISDMAPGCLAYLFCSLITSMIYLTITGFTAKRSYGYLLYTIYFSFLIICLLSEFHFIHPLGTDHHPQNTIE